MLKKVIAAGMVGAVIASIGVAGCSTGTSEYENDIETSQIGEVIETETSMSEETTAAIETSNTAETATEVEESSESSSSTKVDAEGKHVYTILNGKLDVPLETDVYKYVEQIGSGEYSTYFDIFTMAKDLGWEPTSLPEYQEQKISPAYEYSADGYNMEVWFGNNKHGDRTAAGQTASYGFEIGNGLRDGTARSIYVENYAGSIYRTRMDHSISIDYAVLLAYTFERMKEFPGVDPIYDLLADTPYLDEIVIGSDTYNFDALL